MTILVNPDEAPKDASGAAYTLNWFVKVFEANTGPALELAMQTWINLLVNDALPYWIGKPRYIGQGAGNNSRVMVVYIKFTPA